MRVSKTNHQLRIRRIGALLLCMALLWATESSRAADEAAAGPRAAPEDELAAAKAGDCSALLRLGAWYRGGERQAGDLLEAARWFRRAELCFTAGQRQSLDQAGEGLLDALSTARELGATFEGFELPGPDDAFAKPSGAAVVATSPERGDLTLRNPAALSAGDGRGVVVCNRGGRDVLAAFLETRPRRWGTIWMIQAWRNVTAGDCRQIYAGSEALINVAFATYSPEEGLTPFVQEFEAGPRVARDDNIESYCVRDLGVNDRGKGAEIRKYRTPCLPGFVEVPTSATVVLQGRSQMTLEVQR